MPVADDIFIKIGGSAKELMASINQGITGLNKLRTQMNSFAHAGVSSFGSLTKSIFSLQNVLAGSAVAAGLGWGIKLATEAQQSSIAFEVMLGSASKAKNMLGELKQFANVSPFSNVQVREAAQLLLNYGVSGHKVIPTIKQLGDIASGDGVKLEGLSRAFGQITATGRLMGGDLNQLISNGFNPLQEISARTGESMLMLKARMEAGGVSVKEVEQALEDATSEGGRFFGMTERQSKSTAGLWSSAMDVIENSATALGQQLIKAFSIDELLTGFNETFGSVSATIESLTPITEMYRDIFKSTFADMQSVLGDFNGSAGGTIGLFSFGADVLAVFGKAGYGAFHLIQGVAGGLLFVSGGLMKAWTWLNTEWGKKPDYAFADAFIAEAKKMTDKAGTGLNAVIDTKLPSEKIKELFANANNAQKQGKADLDSKPLDPVVAGLVKDGEYKLEVLKKQIAEAKAIIKTAPDPGGQNAAELKKMEQEAKELESNLADLRSGKQAQATKATPGEDKAAKVIAELMAERDVLNDATHAKERYKLAQMGVSESQLDMIDGMRAENAGLKEIKALQAQIADVGVHGKERFKLAQQGVKTETLDYIDQLRKELEAKKAIDDEDKKLKEKSKHVKDDILTPLQKSKKEFAELQKMFAKGLISGDEFTKASQKLDQEQEKSHKSQFGKFTLAGSQEDREAILKFQNPQKTTDYAKESVSVQKQMLKELRSKNRTAPPEDYDSV